MNLGGNTSSTATSVPNGQFFAPTAGNLVAPPVSPAEGAKLYATPPIHRSFFATDVAFTIISLRTHLQKEPLRRSRSLSTTAKPDEIMFFSPSGAVRRRMASLARRSGCRWCS